MDNIKEYLSSAINTVDDIAPAVGRVLDESFRPGWTVRFTDKRRVFGSCLDTRVIELSRPFCESYINLDKSEIIRVILHELAHAMVMENIGGNPGTAAGRHGKEWRDYCEKLGIPGEKAKQNPKVLANSLYKWFLVNHETGEIYERFFTKPKKRDYSRCWIKGRREETEGKLALVNRLGVPGGVFS